jgi:hypothetical protein
MGGATLSAPAAALAILRVEWTTRRAIIRAAFMACGRLGPQFKSLIERHWME